MKKGYKIFNKATGEPDYEARNTIAEIIELTKKDPAGRKAAIERFKKANPDVDVVAFSDVQATVPKPPEESKLPFAPTTALPGTTETVGMPPTGQAPVSREQMQGELDQLWKVPVAGAKGLATGLAVDVPRFAGGVAGGMERYGLTNIPRTMAEGLVPPEQQEAATRALGLMGGPIGVAQSLQPPELEAARKAGIERGVTDIRDITARTEQMPFYQVDVSKMSQTEKDVYSGLRSLPVSMAAGVPGFVMGGPVGAAVATLGAMGLSSADTFVRDWEERSKTDPKLNAIIQKLADDEKIPFDEAKKKTFDAYKINQKGILYGLAEAVPEAVGNLITFWSAGMMGKLGQKVATQPLKQTLVSLLERYPVGIGGEVSTELVTTAVQREIEKAAGESVESLQKSLRDTFGSTVVMSVASLGLLGSGNTAIQRSTIPTKEKAEINLKVAFAAENPDDQKAKIVAQKAVLNGYSRIPTEEELTQVLGEEVAAKRMTEDVAKGITELWQDKHKATLVAEEQAVRAEQLGAELTQEQAARQEAEKTAATDQLTGVKTRRGLEATKTDTHKNSIIFDIDFFKKVNDTYGHPVGDVVLKEVSNRARTIAEESGAEIGRIGGEEFVLLVPEGVDAVALGEKIRQEIKSTPIKAGETSLPITVSVGVDAISTKGDPWASADKNLYKAKQGGRDQVVGPEVTPPSGVEGKVEPKVKKDVLKMVKQKLEDIQPGLTVKDITKVPAPEWTDIYDAIIENAKIDGHTNFAAVLEYGKKDLSTVAKEFGEKAYDLIVGFENYLRKIFAPKETGEKKTRGLAQSVEERAVANRLTDDLGELPEYRTMNFTELAQKVVEFMDSNWGDAVQIALGEKPAPAELPVGMIFRGVETRAMMKGDTDLIYKLGTSEKAAGIATEAGRAVAAYGQYDQSSPVRAIKAIVKAHKDAQKGRVATKEDTQELADIKRRLDEAIKQHESDLERIARLESERVAEGMRRETAFQARKAGRRRAVQIIDAEIDQLASQLLQKTATTSFAGLDPTLVPIVGKMGWLYFEKGVKTIEEIVDSIHVKLEEKFDKRAIRDAITNYGKIYVLNREELQIEWRNQKAIGRLLSALEDSISGKLPAKSGFQRDTPSARQRELRRQINQELRKQGLGLEPLSEETRFKTTNQARITALKNQIEDLERLILTKEKRPDKVVVPLTAEVVELRKKRDALKEEYLVATGQEKTQKTPEEIKIERLKKYLENREKTIINRINAGDFSRAIPKKISFDRQTQINRENVDRLSKAYNSLRQKAEKSQTGITKEEGEKIISLAKDISEKQAKVTDWNDRSGEGAPMAYGRALVDFHNYVNSVKERVSRKSFGEMLTKPGHLVSQVAGIAKSIKASMDNSAIFRQGWKTLWTNPKIWAKNALRTWEDMAKTIGGKEMLDEVMADAVSRPNKDRYKMAKLALGNIEEQFPAHFLGTKLQVKGFDINIPGKAYRAAEAAFTGFVYRTRMDVFDKYMEIAARSGLDINDKDTLVGIGKLVNSLTGRGSLGRAEPAADVVNNIFFSPRFLKSNFDFLTAHNAPLRLASTFDPKMDPKKRARIRFESKIAATNLLKTATGTAAILMIANAVGKGLEDELKKRGYRVKVDFDPRSTDFGKIRVNDTRFDVTGGMGSLITLATRLITMSSKSSTTGKVRELNTGAFDARTGADVLYDFAEAKLSPAAGVALSLLRNEGFGGERPTPEEIAKELAVPLSITNAIDLLKNPNRAPAVLAIIAEGLGINTNTYSAVTWHDDEEEKKVAAKYGVKLTEKGDLIPVLQTITDNGKAIYEPKAVEIMTAEGKRPLTGNRLDEYQTLRGLIIRELLLTPTEGYDPATSFADEKTTDIIVNNVTSMAGKQALGLMGDVRYQTEE